MLGVQTTVERLNSRPRPSDQLDRLFSGGWPEFIFHDDATDRYLGRVRELFTDFELVLLDSDDRLVAGGWAVPVCWDGTVADLPGGYTDSLARALDAQDGPGTPDTLVVLAAQVHPELQGRGLAGALLTAMRELADRSGLPRVICPVRPTLKASYPLTPIERYAGWVRADGQPFDPWIRTHARLGATILASAPHSQVITGTVWQWEDWTGLSFPDSGDYVIPAGLSVLSVDHTADLCTYREPNVWMRHR